MSQKVRFNTSMSVLSFIVLFRSSSSSSRSNKSKSSSCSSSPNNDNNNNSPASQHSTSSSSSSSSSNIDSNKPNKSWPRKIRNKFKKLFDHKSTKKKKSSGSNNTSDHSCVDQPISSSVSLSPSATRKKSSVQFSPVCVIIDENSRPCGHKPLNLEPSNVVDRRARYDGLVNLEFRRDFVKMQRDFFRELDELEDREVKIVVSVEE